MRQIPGERQLTQLQERRILDEQPRLPAEARQAPGTPQLAAGLFDVEIERVLPEVVQQLGEVDDVPALLPVEVAEQPERPDRDVVGEADLEVRVRIAERHDHDVTRRRRIVSDDLRGRLALFDTERTEGSPEPAGQEVRYRQCCDLAPVH